MVWHRNRDEEISFNPRSRAGSDPLSSLLRFSIWMFQSTLPRGERPDDKIGPKSMANGFNPRSRAGSDLTKEVIA